MKIVWHKLAELELFNKTWARLRDKDCVKEILDANVIHEFLIDNPDINFEVQLLVGKRPATKIYLIEIKKKYYCFIVDTVSAEILPFFDIPKFCKIK